MFGPVVAECLKDGNTPVRLAAERCALHAFQLTKGIAPYPQIILLHAFFAFVRVLILQFKSRGLAHHIATIPH